MFLYTRMGWLTLFLWLGAILLASQNLPLIRPLYPPGWPAASAVFFTAAALSSPVIYVLGKILNRHKVPRTIVRWGKERTVLWGTHTFQMLPMEFFGAIIPVMTGVGWLIAHFVA